MNASPNSQHLLRKQMHPCLPTTLVNTFPQVGQCQGTRMFGLTDSQTVVSTSLVHLPRTIVIRTTNSSLFSPRRQPTFLRRSTIYRRTIPTIPRKMRHTPVSFRLHMRNKFALSKQMMVLYLSSQGLTDSP